jgi:uncharacterized protein (UPF0332 family)
MVKVVDVFGNDTNKVMKAKLNLKTVEDLLKNGYSDFSASYYAMFYAAGDITNEEFILF